jgi:hypothetical protein
VALSWKNGKKPSVQHPKRGCRICSVPSGSGNWLDCRDQRKLGPPAREPLAVGAVQTRSAISSRPYPYTVTMKTNWRPTKVGPMTAPVVLPEETLQGGAQRVAEALAEVVEVTALTPQRSSSTPLVRFLAQYEYQLSLEERAVVQRAFLILLNGASRTLTSEKARDTLPDLLFLGTHVVPTADARLRNEVRLVAISIVRRLVQVNDYETATLCISFLADLGIDASTEQLSGWLQAIGPHAALPSFIIISQRSPREAFRWLLRQIQPDELAVRTFRGAFETLMYSEFEWALSGMIDSHLSRIWLQSEYVVGLQEDDDRPVLRQNLLNILQGRPVVDEEDAPASEDADTASGFDSIVQNVRGRISAMSRRMSGDESGEDESPEDVSIDTLRHANPDTLRDQALSLR